MPIQVSGRYADIHSFENLWLSYRKAAKGKRNRAAAARFEFKLADKGALPWNQLQPSS